ncbi:ABC transporter ATP-binding protein [Marinactinospora thermotolerans]|uniref:ABC-2 type transport system ATP-binding protein n=1 Tax=Marinactinospora thermotolerans DSM 45154 TaxID=1122192 RepID=A0A1T4KL80_9ACTN|nr:ATP-binding cassette domain-containing protein [Marinactinospora thermotolerans]SJZ43160.1 ABC-2 type transport system ATP-binding protein [Marinactinospora thermotolerans DSM 45154]
MSLLDIRDVSMAHGRTRVLRNIDLRIEPGHVYGLLGPNGSGKTTLLKSILGANDHTGVIERAPGLRVGRLIEYPAFYGGLTLRENLELHARYLRTPLGEIPGLLAEVGLGDRADLRFSRTSLGMRQRLGIARALLGEPGLVLLDEPTNGLDPIGIRDIRELIRAVQRERGTSMIVSSHNLTEIASLADHLLFMKAGRIIRRMAAREVHGDLEDLYATILGDGA